MIWSFRVFIADLIEFDDGQTDALYEAGCADGSLTSGELKAWIDFDREARSLQQAIASAVTQVRSVGLEVERVELLDVAETTVSHWAEAVCS